MRARYQSNPRVAILGMALSLGLIFGSQELAGGWSAPEPAVEAEIEAAGSAAPALSVEPASRAVAQPVDQRTC